MYPFINRLSKKQIIALAVICGVVLILIVGLLVPSVREKIVYRWDQLTTRIFFTVSSPEKSVFVPEKQLATAVQQTLTTMPATVTPTSEPSVVPEFTATPTMVPTSLPALQQLDKVPYIDQHGLWNYCAPSNLAMQLAFWGWSGKRTDIGQMVKPMEKDKNVMPYELADYVNENTNLKALVRVGGTVDLLKTLVANGFPVLIEKGVYFPEASTGKVSWMGHFNIVLGYDDAKQQFITHDSFLPDGKFKRFSYDDLKQQWRSFNYIFLVVYPAEKFDMLNQVLGDYADEGQSYNIALKISADEMANTTGADHFFAIFNRGTSLVKLQDFNGASAAYDQAYNFYATLPEQNRPYRMTWYQTGPYFAYYYSARYADVITLADTTLTTTNEPFLEESYYWRALAEVMAGKRDLAIKDLCTSLTDHPNFPPSMSQLKDMGLGVSACQ